MRKDIIINFFCIVVIFMIVGSCRKEPILPENVWFSAAEVSITATTATYQVSYNDVHNIETVSFLVYADRDLSELVSQNMAKSNTNGVNRLKIEGLEGNTTYYYQFRLANDKYAAHFSKGSFTTNEYSVPTVTTKSVTSINGVSAKCQGLIAGEECPPIIERGMCWGTGQNPSVEGTHIAGGEGMGTFTCSLGGLSVSTQYYVRSYAVTSQGTYYGEQIDFSTTKGFAVLTTNTPSSIAYNAASCGGEITDDGGFRITARGVCWSTNQNPKINDSHTTDGEGAGFFSSSITELQPGTTYYVRAYATNSVGTSYGTQVTFTTTIIKPTVSTSSVSDITSSTASCGGNVTATGGASVTARGVCWSTSQSPTTGNSHTSNGTGAGTFSSSITGLTAGTTYYVRAYATNSAGTSYGTQVSFTTNASSPTVTTSSVSNITSSTASCGGKVTATGGATVTARGVCWSTSQNPTTGNSHTSNGTGSGTFSSTITGLSANTTYYVRAYATNGLGTSYGSQVTFTTGSPTPTVSTSSVSNITSSTASCGGNVTARGDASVTARGVCWSTSQNPTISDGYTTNGTGTGSYTSIITGLLANTTYYVRAYATNSLGTAYGSQVSFTTAPPPPPFQDITVNGVTFRMIRVEGGTFNMGAQSTYTSQANYDSQARSNESPVHSVTLSNYYIGQVEVTQDLWTAVMGSSNTHGWSSTYGLGSNYPAYNIAYSTAQYFISQLNTLTGMNFRMPTEAEWEYAARGGNQSHHYKYSGSNTIGNVAWYSGYSSTGTHPVASLQANELGIYDMCGNVSEWCSDWNGSYSSSAQTNPSGPTSGSFRVMRGGGWVNDARGCRLAYRYSFTPWTTGNNCMGFRLALSE